jgi:ribosomal protein L11 methyltransferase
MESDWIVLRLPLPTRGEGYLVADALHGLGAQTIDREGTDVVARIPVGSGELDRLLARARGVIHAVSPIAAAGMSWHPASEAETSGQWRSEVRPIQVGRRILLSPVDETSVAPEGSGLLTVRLVPGPGFGTGEHPTTRSCLRLLEQTIRPGARVCDLGSGNGVLAIAAVLLGAERVTAIEADLPSCGTLRRNAAANGTLERSCILQRRIGPGGLVGLGPFDGVLANLGTEAIGDLLPDLATALADGGWLILSGIPEVESPSASNQAGDLGLVKEAEVVEGGWWTGAFRR